MREREREGYPHGLVTMTPFLSFAGTQGRTRAMKECEIVTVRFGTGRQKMAHERWTNPKVSRRTCARESGQQPCRGKSAGVAKRPQSSSPPRNPSPVPSRPFLCLACSPEGTHRLFLQMTHGQPGWCVLMLLFCARWIPASASVASISTSNSAATSSGPLRLSPPCGRERSVRDKRSGGTPKVCSALSSMPFSLGGALSL